jgi:hypothetical protein
MQSSGDGVDYEATGGIYCAPPQCRTAQNSRVRTGGVEAGVSALETLRGASCRLSAVALRLPREGAAPIARREQRER